MGLIIFLVLILIGHVGLYKTFEKAGKEGWKALVPGYNLYVWNEIIGRPQRRLFWLLVPIVNFFIFAAMLIELAKSFDKHDFIDHVYAVALAPLYLAWLGFSSEAKAKYVGQGYLIEKANPRKKTVVREWSEAIIFAVFAATFIRMFLIEAYTIPTPSMEGSLLVGDFLFVSKINYGSRAPMTPIQFPLVHNTIPLSNKESYLEWIKWPYKRLAAIEKIERFDPVVFNFPEGDTILVAKKKSYDPGTNNYYTLSYIYKDDPVRMGMFRNPEYFKMVTRPIDKRDNYIKRCIGLPGEKLEVKNQKVLIDDTEIKEPPKVQYGYMVKIKGVINKKRLVDWKIIDKKSQPFTDGIYHLNNEQAEKLKKADFIASIEKQMLTSGGNRSYPNNAYNWSVDNFGPVNIPKKGENVKLTLENLPLYRRVISVYEGNTLEVKDGKIIINGQETDNYTIKMDYYFMMGDNRHNSEDSRVWGFVPHDHIVGKPLFIWFSRSKAGVRWSRIFSGANSM